MMRPRGRALGILIGAALAAAVGSLALEGHSTEQQPAPAAARATMAPTLVPTVHPPLPTALSAFWIASAAETSAPAAAVRDFVRGVRLLEDADNAAAALPLLSAGALASTPMADYARYYTGIALRRLERRDEAEAAFASLVAKRLDGHLSEDAALRQAEVREAKGDMAGAAAIYEEQLTRRLSQTALYGLRLGAASEQLGDRRRATAAYRRVYDEFPTSAEAGEAEQALTRLGAWDDDWPVRAPREWARASTLFTARRFTAARSSYERLRDATSGADRNQALVRLAAIDVLTGNGKRARDVLAAHRGDPGDTGLEAQFYYLGATRIAGQHDAFEAATRAFVDSHAGSIWAEEALNNLATHHILVDEDDRAEQIFNEMLTRFPTGRNAERAAWRAGWWAYRSGDFKNAIRIFEQASASSPRSDYRPPWLYWSARAYDQLNDREAATARYHLTATDYLNSYYGRLAVTRLKARGITTVPPNVKRVATAPDASVQPPTAGRIDTLMSLGLYREALNELQYAQRVWGDAPRLQATVALVQNRLGELRLGINAMKRAYPQFLASGGEELPKEILEVLFPVNYWPLLQKHAAAKGLDPFLLAALVAQESTFDPVVRSSANAIGLMQILPATGRQYARRIGIRPFSTARLTEPEVNVRIGTTYFAELVKEFGGVHFALASYNAGESRVREWKAERASLQLGQEEFIDDIPFPETQNYVKRILGTAEDYRRLYSGTSGLTTTDATRVTPAPRKATPRSVPATKVAPQKKKAPPPKKKPGS
jgi:soluble lytic murein transglycosylase